jgi:hypothetical protein
MNVCPCCKTTHDSTACPTREGKGLDAMSCSARLSFIRVTTKGCEGTINLMWDDYPVAWVNNVQIAREMMREIPEQNK